MLSLRLTVAAALGPAFVTTWVYVIFPPACTGTGLAELVIDRSTELETVSVAVAVLFAVFGSPAVGATDAVCVIVVPLATVVLTFTTYVNVAVALADKLAILHVGVPVVVQVQPAGPVRETNVVFAGSGSLNVTVVAEAGPPLVTTCV